MSLIFMKISCYRLLKNKRIISVSVLLVVSVLNLSVARKLFSVETGGQKRLEAILRSVARPRLIYPNDTIVVLDGQKKLEFKWGLASGPMRLDYIDFFIYKGAGAAEENLLFKTRLSFNEYSVKLDSALFEDNQVYTWGIRQFFLRGKKDNSSLALFRVYKRK